MDPKEILAQMEATRAEQAAQLAALDAAIAGVRTLVRLEAPPARARAARAHPAPRGRPACQE